MVIMIYVKNKFSIMKEKNSLKNPEKLRFLPKILFLNVIGKELDSFTD